jgi:hypothetical protein
MNNMASRVAINNMRNLPVKTAKAYEGTFTRYNTAISPNGGVVDGAGVYSAPIAKGDMVKLKAGTDKGFILVEKAAAGNDLDYIHGIAVSSPQGVDNVTVSGATPAVAYNRKVDVAFFGLAIVELVAEGTMVVGNRALKSESVTNGVVDAGSAPTVNGALVNLAYATVGEFVPVLVGAAVYHPAD